VRSNKSIDTDPQQQKAASPQVLVVRSFSRYTDARRQALHTLDMSEAQSLIPSVAEAETGESVRSRFGRRGSRMPSQLPLLVHANRSAVGRSVAGFASSRINRRLPAPLLEAARPATSGRRYNKAVNTDAQGRPLAALAPVLGRGLLLR
jgi:hypothetical protein